MSIALLKRAVGFQSTLPRGSDRIQFPPPICTTNSIPAPPRERPSANYSARNEPAISIHAPSRERLAVNILIVQYLSISIHAPSRERLPARPSSQGQPHFNPRSLAGATQIGLMEKNDKGISIHAPSRERQPAGNAKIFA